jgi:hypothetical protein
VQKALGTLQFRNALTINLLAKQRVPDPYFKEWGWHTYIPNSLYIKHLQIRVWKAILDIG